MTDGFVTINTRVTTAMRDSFDRLAKEYNVTRSEMMRILIVEVIDDDLDDNARQYSRREETGGDDGSFHCN